MVKLTLYQKYRREQARSEDRKEKERKELSEEPVVKEGTTNEGWKDTIHRENYGNSKWRGGGMDRKGGSGATGLRGGGGDEYGKKGLRQRILSKWRSLVSERG